MAIYLLSDKTIVGPRFISDTYQVGHVRLARASDRRIKYPDVLTFQPPGTIEISWRDGTDLYLQYPEASEAVRSQREFQGVSVTAVLNPLFTTVEPEGRCGLR